MEIDNFRDFFTEDYFFMLTTKFDAVYLGDVWGVDAVFVYFDSHKDGKIAIPVQDIFEIRQGQKRRKKRK